MTIRLHVFLLFTLTVPLYAHLNEEQKKLTSEFQPPLEVQKKLDQFFSQSHFYRSLSQGDFSESLLKKNIEKDNFTILKLKISPMSSKRYYDIKLIGTHPSLPDYIIKLKLPSSSATHYKPSRKNISRIIGISRLKKSIEKHHITLVAAPIKHLYHLPNRDIKLEDQNYAVIAKKQPCITFNENSTAFSSLSKKHHDELFTVMNDMGYHDASPNNIYLTPHNTFLFIDTELDKAIWDIKKPFKSKNGFFKKLCSIRGQAKFCKWNSNAPRSFLSSLFIALNIV